MDQRGFDAQQQPYCSRQVVAMSRDRHAGQLTPVMPVGGLIGRNVIPIDRLVDPSHSLTHQPDQAGTSILTHGKLTASASACTEVHRQTEIPAVSAT